MWTAQECAKLEPPAIPTIPVAVLRPRILITMPAEGGTLIWLRVQGFYKRGLGLWALRQVGRRGARLAWHFVIHPAAGTIIFCITSWRSKKSRRCTLINADAKGRPVALCLKV